MRPNSLGSEWVYWINVRICGDNHLFLKAPRLHPGEPLDLELSRNFDAASTFAVTAALTVLVYALVDATNAGGRRGGRRPARPLGCAVRSLRGDRARSEGSLVPFGIFRVRTLTSANGIRLMIGASLFSMFFFIFLYMRQVLGYFGDQGWASLLPLALMIIVAAAIGSQLVTRWASSLVLAAGLRLNRDQPLSGSPSLLRDGQAPRATSRAFRC